MDGPLSSNEDNLGLPISPNPSATIHQVRTQLDLMNHSAIQIEDRVAQTNNKNPIATNGSEAYPAADKKQKLLKPPDKHLSSIRVNRTSNREPKLRKRCEETMPTSQLAAKSVLEEMQGCEVDECDVFLVDFAISNTN